MVLTLAAGVSWLWVPPPEVTRGVVVRVGSLGSPLPAFGPARLRMSDPTHHSPTSTSSTTSAAPAFGRRLRELGEVLRRLRLVPVLALVLVLAMRRIRPPAVGGRAEVERNPHAVLPSEARSISARAHTSAHTPTGCQTVLVSRNAAIQ